ncbi:DUF5060 domain-containing protein [Colwellia sp. UCD-KL20]|uniref:Kelch repeat-containing protein n=1 Tax=Colwellia sp. UCD-KL20 TaxID=1917165 RepID=UPI0015C301C6|nr:DUF5060 domain-containing protein [Colwellia sp. UCD-KL20]
MPNNTWTWETVNATGTPVARHEAGLVAFDKKLYLIGGRRINPTSIFNTESKQWTNGSQTPIELHHIQPVLFENKIYIVGALTGKWPNEKPVDKVIIYDPQTDSYEYSHEIPEHRRRGGAGVTVHNGKIYIVGGITNGHMDGYKPWFDEYNPKTGHWKTLPDAPIARDHFQSAIIDNKLYAFAGRKTSKSTDEDMALTISYGNIFNFTSGKWEQTTTRNKIPTKRAGNAVFVWNNQLIIGGGESSTQVAAHNEVEAFNPQTKQWYNWPKLSQGRHGTGFGIINGYVYTASGSGKHGGEPELYTIERLKLPDENTLKNLATIRNPPSTIKPLTKQWHTLTLNFNGPTVSENDKSNPFLHYKLLVKFTHNSSQTTITVPGYFAADGNAAESSATSGDIWQVKFNPNKLGEWSYKATLYSGENIALSKDYSIAKQAKLKQPKGDFLVIPTDKDDQSFKAHGRLIAKDGFFKFQDSSEYWLKGGTNSPENLLGYKDFDGTYRVAVQARDGEAAPNKALHHYSAHLKDWQTGDPQWKREKGRSLIGSINYLAKQGMNSAYFLTMNILGDGKDVWPYINHKDFTRFDISKLSQWEIVFEHMQDKGILLHIVVQETENEKMLDEGDTGPLRQLYFNELIARFGHHLGLVWNLGEENGYAKWAPNAQNTEQRKAMASYLKSNDPYNHPVLLHTHAHDPDRENILTPLLGFKDIDGLSLQQDKRELVPSVIKRWRKAAKDSGHEWLITMDEIGMWHTAALPDSVDSEHNTLRQHALWGSILAGGAGVEWYFGAKYPHNDLTSEDWRQRHNLWQLTQHAKLFFTQHVPYWLMKPCGENILNTNNNFCSQKKDEIYVFYQTKNNNIKINLPYSFNGAPQLYDIQWYDPINGGLLLSGSKKQLISGNGITLGKAPNNKDTDWVILIKKNVTK